MGGDAGPRTAAPRAAPSHDPAELAALEAAAMGFVDEKALARVLSPDAREEQRELSREQRYQRLLEEPDDTASLGRWHEVEANMSYAELPEGMADVGGKYFQYRPTNMSDANAPPPKLGELIGPESKMFYSRAFSTQDEQGNAMMVNLRSDGTVENHHPVRPIAPEKMPSFKDRQMIGLPGAKTPAGYTSDSTPGSGNMAQDNASLREGGRGYGHHECDKDGRDDHYASADNMAAHLNSMYDYATLFPGSKLSINDLSNVDGNTFNPHKTHFCGGAGDFRYPHGEGSLNAVPTSEEDLFRLQSKVFLDERWGAETINLGSSLKGKIYGKNVEYNSGHNDHIHTRIGPKQNQPGFRQQGCPVPKQSSMPGNELQSGQAGTRPARPQQPATAGDQDAEGIREHLKKRSK